MRARVAVQQAPATHLQRPSTRRDRQAVKTAGANLISLGANYAIRLAVIPLSLALLGSERYGLFLAVGSLVAWGGLADLGFAPGLVNVVAWAWGRDDREAIRRYISTAFTVYSALAAVLAGATLWASGWPGLTRLLGVRDPGLAADARLLVLVCGLLLGAATLTRVIPTACTALQEGYYGAWPQIAGSLLSLPLLAGLYWSGRGSLLAYALVMGLPPIAAQIGVGLFYFGRRHPDLRPRFGHADRASLRALWGVGWPLAVHQAANLAVLYSANILIANRLGPAAVPHYSVPYALYSVLCSVASCVIWPYTPAYAEAAARGDFTWVRHRARLALVFSAGLVGAGAAVVVVVGGLGVRLWTGGRIRPSTGLLAALACFSVARACSEANTALLTGLSLVRPMAFVRGVVAVLYSACAWWLLPRMGVAAAPVAGALGYFVDAVLTGAYAFWRMRQWLVPRDGAWSCAPFEAVARNDCR